MLKHRREVTEAVDDGYRFLWKRVRLVYLDRLDDMGMMTDQRICPGFRVLMRPLNLFRKRIKLPLWAPMYGDKNQVAP